MIKAADIDTLVELFEHSNWQALQLEFDGVSIHLSKTGKAAAENEMSVQKPAPSAPISAPQPSASPPVKTAVEAPAGGKANIPEGWVAVRAPNLGTFYRSPKPGSDPYVQVGQKIEPTTEVCLLEVMKLFTAVQAGARGIVREILIKDGELVEHDQPLILIEAQA